MAYVYCICLNLCVVMKLLKVWVSLLRLFNLCVCLRGGRKKRKREEEDEPKYVSCGISLSLIPLRQSFTEPGARLIAPESLLTLHPPPLLGLHMTTPNSLHGFWKFELRSSCFQSEHPTYWAISPAHLSLLLYKKIAASLQSFNATNHLINNSKAMNINIAGFKDELDLVPPFRELMVQVELNHSQIDHPPKCPTCSPQAYACQGG